MMLGQSFQILERYKKQSVEEGSSSLDISTLRVIISKLESHGGCPPYIRFGPPDVALPVMRLPLLGQTKGVHDGSRIRPTSRFIIGLLCWISRHFENPFPSPVVLPHKNPCFVSIDGVCSLSDMHGNSILRILVLHCPPVLCHMDFQCPPSLTNIGS